MIVDARSNIACALGFKLPEIEAPKAGPGEGEEEVNALAAEILRLWAEGLEWAAADLSADMQDAAIDLESVEPKGKFPEAIKSIVVLAQVSSWDIKEKAGAGRPPELSRRRRPLGA